ncbi:MAG: cyclase family protein [Actinobacteria bacterium]|nr:cyclase family protein [Actinomycetota bacterium]
MGKIIDISVSIYSGMPYYPGDPGAEVHPSRLISEGAVANLSELRLGSHTGTHIDAPNHFDEAGVTVDDLPLEVLVGSARVVDLTEAGPSISREHLERAGVMGVRRLLLKTGNSVLWSRSEFSKDYVSVAEDAAEYLVELGVVLLGIDYLSVEKFNSDTFRVHHTLLGAGVVLLEGIDLGSVAAGDYELVCLPLKIRGGDGAPARAILIEQ